MNASLRRLSTVMFSPSQNCVMVALSEIIGWVASFGFFAALRSASVTRPISCGFAGSFNDQTERAAVPLAAALVAAADLASKFCCAAACAADAAAAAAVFAGVGFAAAAAAAAAEAAFA